MCCFFFIYIPDKEQLLLSIYQILPSTYLCASGSLAMYRKVKQKKVEVIGAFEGLTKTCRLNARDRMLDSYAHMVIEHHLCVPAVTCARAQNLLVIKTNLFLNVREWLPCADINSTTWSQT